MSKLPHAAIIHQKLKWALIFLLVIGAAACSFSSAQRADRTAAGNSFPSASKYVWREVATNSPWGKMYNYQMFRINDSLWVLHPNGFWYSENGRDWRKSSLNDSVGNQAFLDYVIFKGALYAIGHLDGNIEKFTFRPEIYRTTNMRNWEVVSKNSNLPVRYFYHPFVFNQKIWIIGGEYKDQKYADIWNSGDGITWVKQKDALPFGPRSNSQIVSLNGRLYLLNNDVWSSADGLDWQLVTNEIVRGYQIFGYTAVVFDNKIWLLGCNRNGLFSSQVLASADGRTWASYDAPWSPRGAVAADVFENKVYLTGGKYGGTPDRPNFIYSNDLWTMEVGSED